jgi:hypothetical protein
MRERELKLLNPCSVQFSSVLLCLVKIHPLWLLQISCASPPVLHGLNPQCCMDSTPCFLRSRPGPSLWHILGPLFDKNHQAVFALPPRYLLHAELVRGPRLGVLG